HARATAYRSKSGTQPQPEPAIAISSSTSEPEPGNCRAARESALPAVKQLQWSPTPMDWAPQKLATAALVSQSRSGPIPARNMRNRISDAHPAQHCGCSQALAGPVRILHRSYYLPISPEILTALWLFQLC